MMLNAVDLAIGYRSVPVGRGITLAVSSGEVLCLLGPNGCGKTTLFRALLGLLPPLGGQLELDGQTVASFTRTEFAKRVAYVPQAQPATFPFTVIEMVLMGRASRASRASRVGTFASPSAYDVAAAHGALEALGISRLGERLFTEISGGERQMSLLARALAQEPALIVMDEPTASLDFGNQARVLERIRALSDGGLAIVFSTHDPGQAFACAHRVALMKAGHVIAHGAPDDVVTPDALRRLYGVDVAVAYLEQAGRNVCAPTLSNRETQQ
ncbi:ABC transporter ATP-binding protein [Hyphomicrobium sp.]|uniref:ABC transporter ATP-binding protein n=1 Tax=Hyphomicrobium sp. TaxID=82 RepID=UPI002FE24336